MKTFTTNNTNLINILLVREANFTKQTRYSVSFNILDLTVAAACRMLNRVVYDGLTFKLDPAGWVNVYDGGALIGTIE